MITEIKDLIYIIKIPDLLNLAQADFNYYYKD